LSIIVRNSFATFMTNSGFSYSKLIENAIAGFLLIGRGAAGVADFFPSLPWLSPVRYPQTVFRLCFASSREAPFPTSTVAQGQTNRTFHDRQMIVPVHSALLDDLDALGSRGCDSGSTRSMPGARQGSCLRPDIWDAELR
jgi:hypothetical protein